jgi:hypothetical protein
MKIESKAIASFGSKDLIDPEKGRKVFQQIEKKARHQLAKFSTAVPGGQRSLRSVGPCAGT